MASNTQHMKREFFKLGIKADALKAAALLTTNAKEPCYIGSTAIEPAHWAAAKACGDARRFLKIIRGRKAWESRGKDDERIDTEGALAEILMALVLEKAPNLYIAPLVAHKPDAGGVDIALDGRKVDVKSISQFKTMVTVNQHQHFDKAAAVYVLVHLVRRSVADIYVVNTEHVPAWTLNTKLRDQDLDPRRYYYSACLPLGRLEPLPAEEATA